MTMNSKHQNHIQTFITEAPISVRDRQAPLRSRYDFDPESAWVFDHARTTGAEVPANHPIHGHVICGEGVPIDVPVSVHRAVGGESDFPCPGEILAAALAGCLDSSIKMVANLMNIQIVRLEVHASLGADVRGALVMGQNVPVGFQSAQMKVDIETEAGLPAAKLDALLNAAERSCVILQTLRAPPKVEVEFNINAKAVQD